MTEYVHALILGIVQGIAEFLPISSSAHLVLTRVGWIGLGLDAPAPDPVAELALDVALHVGTLAAVALYFRRDLAQLVVGGLALIGGRRDGPARLAWLVLVATIPATPCLVTDRKWCWPAAAPIASIAIWTVP